MTFEEWLATTPYAAAMQSGRASDARYRTEEFQQQLRDMYEQMFKPDAAGNLPWGTMGLGVLPGQDAEDMPALDTPSFYGGRDPFTLNGQKYARVGEDLRQTFSSHPKEVQDYLRRSGVPQEQWGTYDPQNGYGVPYDLYAGMGQIAEREQAGDLSDMFSYAPQIIGSIATGAALGGAFPGIGAAGEFIPAGQTGIWSQLSGSDTFGKLMGDFPSGGGESWGVNSRPAWIDEAARLNPEWTFPDPSSAGGFSDDVYQALADGRLSAAEAAAAGIPSDAITAIGQINAAGGPQALGFGSMLEAVGAANPAFLSAGSSLLNASTLSKLLGPAATLASGALGANAAGRAADAQVASTNAAIGEQRRQFDLTRSDNEPFRVTGTLGNARLRALLGLDSSYTGSDSGSLVRRFTKADMEADPVYQSGLQFGLDEGRKAIDARAVAGGGYDSGATIKAQTKYATDYADTKGADAYNRYMNDQTAIYNRLAGVSGTGQTAVNTIANAGTNAANQIGEATMGGGNARAAGIVGGANAWGSAAQGVNNWMNSQRSNDILEALLRGSP